jgi:hypothetical protein
MQEKEKGFFDPGRIVVFLIAHSEISCQSIFATCTNLSLKCTLIVGIGPPGVRRRRRRRRRNSYSMIL